MNDHLKVLFVEDIQSDAELAVRELKKGGLSFDYKRVETKNELTLALNEFRPDIVISDYTLPSYSGLQALKDTREFDKFIPFILFTGSVDEEIAVQCMKAGANDYVLKEHPARLPHAVEEAAEKKAVKAAGEKAVQALKESEAYFRSLIEHLSDYLLLANSDGTIKFSNPSFNELIGYTPAEIIGESAFKLIFPGDIEYIKSELKAFLANPEIIREVNIHVIHKNGKSIFLRGKAQNLLTHSLFDGILLTLQDITELKLAEQALLEKKKQIIESNQIMAGILENTHMMAVFLDTKFNFIWVNKAYANTCRKTPAFFQDKNHFDLYPDKENQAIFMHVVDTGNPFFVTAKSFEFPDQPERGITYWDWSLIPVKENDSVTGLVFTLSEVTQRIKAKEVLRKSEEQYRTLFEKSINAIFLVDGKTGQYLNANKAAEELTGRSVESLKKMSTKDVSKSGSDGRLLEIGRIVDNVDFGEIVYHRPDGSKRNALLSAVSIDENLVFGIAMDITDRIQKEVALLKSEERYRVFINSTEDLVFLKDEHLKYIIVNKANAVFFNKSEIEILGKTDFELMPEETAHNCYSTDKLALSSDMVIIQKEKVGDKVYESRKFKILLENASYGVGGYIRDITKEVEAQIALKKSEHLFNTLATISPVGIFHAGTDGRTTYVNPALCQMAGISEESAIGNGWLSAIHPDDTELVVAEMKSSIQNHSGSGFEYRFLRPDGSIVNFIGNAVPEFDSNKHLVGFVGTLTDITELKKMEGNLIEAKEKAEESDRLKTAFLHNISHEIRTPMNAIIGFSALLGEPGLTHDDQILFINTMQQSGDHLLSIITDIFNISNIEANIVKINVNETNLNLTLKMIYDQFLPKADEKKISFHFETALADEKSIIQTDHTKLVEILSNLISNAFKFTKQGEIAFGYLLKDQLMEFYVSDTGIGIPTDQHTKIFDRFYQVENTVSRQYEGTGLGLAICKSYVELLGGKLWLTSEKDKGSVFYFTIPFRPGKQPEEHLIIENNIHTGFYNKTIIIAEDDETNYILVHLMLSGLGLNILHAWDGSEVVAICKNPGIDLVLMDMKMPIMDGFEATRKIKEILPDLPIIAQTAYALAGDTEKVIAAGCDDYIAKPLNKGTLISLLNKYL